MARFWWGLKFAVVKFHFRLVWKGEGFSSGSSCGPTAWIANPVALWSFGFARKRSCLPHSSAAAPNIFSSGDALLIGSLTW